MTPTPPQIQDASSNQFPKTRALIFTLCAVCLPNMVSADALIDQSGDAHVATINQEAVSYQASASIYQAGESNNAATIQADLADYTIVSETNQTGEHNETSIEQASLTHDARAGASSTGNRNTIRIRQINPNDDVLFAEAIQTGDDNQVVILQENNEFGSAAIVYQEGVSNVTWLEQSDGGAESADLVQIGDNNITTVYQVGGSVAADYGGSTYTYISGNENEVTIEQSGALGSSVSYVQVGSSSTANIYQTGETQILSMANDDAHNNMDTVYQTSESGTIFVTRQGTSDSDTNILQTGGWNVIQVDQLVSNSVTANVIQDGAVSEFHEAAILQTNSENSVATIEQSGLESMASIEQHHVTDSEASIIQSSQSIQADITQHLGESNLAAIIQTVGAGEGVSASIYQTGNGNEAIISQM